MNTTLPLILGCALAGAAAAAPPHVIDGRAYDLESGRLLYVESHRFRYGENGRLLADEVRYRAPDGELIATKQVDYSASEALPAFHTRMLDSGYEEGLRRDEAGLQLFTRPDGDAGLRSKTLAADACEAADAGFDPFVREHFDELVRNETVTFRFCAAEVLRPITFRARRAPPARDGIVTIHATASILFGLISETLELDYDRDSRELIEFRGISNIRDPGGKAYRVRLDYGDSAATADVTTVSSR